MTVSPHDSWPTPRQAWLLKAALLKGDAAVSAFHQWIPSLDLDNLEEPSVRLLPLLYHHLHSKVHHPIMDRLKSVYRRAWYGNHVFLELLTEIVKAFQEKGIPVLLLKGTALLLTAYKDGALRPLGDLDLLVSVENKEDSFRLMQDKGWELVVQKRKIFKPHPAVHFINAKINIIVDLHWMVRSILSAREGDRDFWESSLPVSFNQTEARVLDPADQIIHLCVHGLLYSPRPAIRWVPDVLKVHDAYGASLDWDRFLYQAHKRRVGLICQKALAYLQKNFEAPFPEKVLKALRDFKTFKRERVYFFLLIKGQRRGAGILARKRPWWGLKKSWITYLLWSWIYDPKDPELWEKRRLYQWAQWIKFTKLDLKAENYGVLAVILARFLIRKISRRIQGMLRSNQPSAEFHPGGKS